MPPVRLTRAQQQAVTRERLLAAAEIVFSEQGYGGASVDLIAAEAGFSKGAVYSNFPNKEALFLELSRQHMDRDMGELQKIVSLEPGKLFDAVSRWLKTMHVDRDCPLMITELQLHARRNAEFAKDYYALQDKQMRTLAEILQKYFDASSATIPMNPIDLAGAIIALSHGISLQRPLGQPGEASEAGRVIDELLRALTRPVGASH